MGKIIVNLFGYEEDNHRVFLNLMATLNIKIFCS